MKKKLLYTVGGIVLIFLLVYFLNEVGIIASLLGGSFFASNKLKKEMREYEKNKSILKNDIDKIRHKRKNLKTEDKSDQEEVEYWKNQ